MKNFLIILFFIIITSCDNKPITIYHIHEGFLREEGKYWIKNSEKQILVRELKNGDVFFAITNKKGECLYQQNILKTFNDYHYWRLYLDEKQNIWYYNSDYSESIAVIFDTISNSYKEFNFCNNKLVLPNKFRQELKNKNFKNCKSFK